MQAEQEHRLANKSQVLQVGSDSHKAASEKVLWDCNGNWWHRVRVRDITTPHRGFVAELGISLSSHDPVLGRIWFRQTL